MANILGFTSEPRLKQLEFLVGDWRLSGVTIDSPMGPGGSLSGEMSVEWIGEFFLVQKYRSVFSVGGHEVVASGYEFYDINPETGRFRTRFFNSFGPYDEVGSSYEGDFEGDSLVMTGPARIIRTPATDGTITYESDVEGPGGYVPMMRGRLTRIA